jgi:DNA-binding MarR family transcriptional regulator
MSSMGSTLTNMAPEHPMADRLGYLLKRAQHALRTRMDDRLSYLGVTTAQFNVLSAVQQQPGISNASLARGAFVTAQSMLGIVANLEKMGLLRRTPHQTHGRIMQSELTQKGTEVLESACEAIVDVEKSMTVGFTAEEIGTLRSMLQRCAQNLHSAESRLLK